MKEANEQYMYDVANEFIEAGRKEGIELALKIVRLYKESKDLSWIVNEVGVTVKFVTETLIDAGDLKQG